MANATYQQAGETYNDLSIVYNGMPEDREASLLIGEDDFTDLMDLGATEITDAGSSARSTARFSLRGTLSAAPAIIDQAHIQLFDHSDHSTVFGGFVRSRHPGSGINPMLDLIADDVGGLLDDVFIASEIRPAETLQNRIYGLWTAYAGPYLADDLTFVDPIGGTLPEQTFANVTLRQAIEATISQAVSDGHYYVDSTGTLHVFSGFSTAAAPYKIVVG
jgi:hypothetical protein